MSVIEFNQSRINGAKSNGPITAEGKARSAMNALKHGRYARSASVLKIEDHVAFRELLDAYYAQFAPQSTVEARVINEIAHIDWTLTRWRAIEIAQINRSWELRDPDSSGAEASHDDLQNLTAALEASIKESRFPGFVKNRISSLLTERNFAYRTLRTLRALRPKNPAPAPKTTKTGAENNIFARPNPSKNVHNSLKNKPLTSR